MKVPVKKIHQDVEIPQYAHEGDAAFDLASAENVVIPAGKRVAIGTGLAFALPEGHVGLIWDRSGLAKKNGITSLGGVIDANYRGEITVVLLNTGDEDYTVNKGDRVAQMLIQPIVFANMQQVDELQDSERGEAAWGSTGK